MTSKSVAQIRAEWQAIEAHRPGGLLPNVVDFLRRLAQVPLGRLTRRDAKAVEIIDVLHEAVKGYHAEMGVLLARLDELDPPAPGDGVPGRLDVEVADRVAARQTRADA